MKSTSIGRPAVVVGAGMAGLPAARVLADYFEQVVVLERDALLFDASHRTKIQKIRHKFSAPRYRALVFEGCGVQPGVPHGSRCVK